MYAGFSGGKFVKEYFGNYRLWRSWEGLARLAEAFGMELMNCAGICREVPEGRFIWQYMLPQIDVLSQHYLLTEDAQNLID